MAVQRLLSVPRHATPSVASDSVLSAPTTVDARILTLAVAAPGEALEALYRAYKDRIYSFLLRMTASAELADDLTQDVFLRANKALRRLGSERALLPWLYRIATNAAIDELRRRRRIPWLRWLSLHGTDDEPRHRDEHGSVDDRATIALALRRLPPENAAALLLHAVEGYSYKEIAEIQGASLTAVRSRIARARIAFRAVYPQIDL